MYVIMLIFFFHCKLCYLLRVRFVEFCFLRVLKSLYYILALDTNFHLMVSILFSWPILMFVAVLT